jgi:hypothetical protein
MKYDYVLIPTRIRKVLIAQIQRGEHRNARVIFFEIIYPLRLVASDAIFLSGLGPAKK